MAPEKLALLGLLAGCGEPTYYPRADLPAYGEGGSWATCSVEAVGSAAGASVLAVENTLREPVDFIWVDPDCTEQLVAEVGSGERHEEEATYGHVFAVRGQENGFLYAHFQWLGEHATVVVP